MCSSQLLQEWSPWFAWDNLPVSQFHMIRQPQGIHLRNLGGEAHMEGIDCSSGKRSQRSKPGRMYAMSMKRMHNKSFLSTRVCVASDRAVIDRQHIQWGYAKKELYIFSDRMKHGIANNIAHFSRQKGTYHLLLISWILYTLFFQTCQHQVTKTTVIWPEGDTIFPLPWCMWHQNLNLKPHIL